MTHDKTVSKFDEWAREGRDAGMEEGHGDVVRQVLEQMDVKAGEKILELGCGNGWATRMLAQSNAGVQAIGVDCAPQMIARADELHSFTIRARYDLGRMEELEFKDGEFTRVFSMEAFYYAEHLDKALAESLRVLKPGGKADIILDHYKENPACHGWADQMQVQMHMCSEEEWKKAFEDAGFVNVELKRVVDSRGPGEASEFEASDYVPDWETHLAGHQAGSLWIQAEKPA